MSDEKELREKLNSIRIQKIEGLLEKDPENEVSRYCWTSWI